MSSRVARMWLTATTLFIVAGAAPPLVSSSKRTPKLKPAWTQQLTRYGFRKFRRGLINDYGSSYQIACTKGSVAVVFNRGIVGHVTWDPHALPASDWEMLFFNPRTGQLTAKRNWTAFEVFKVFPTSRGNYALVLSGLKDDKAPGGRVQLVSDAGADIAAVELSRDTNILSSVTGESLLLVRPLPEKGWTDQVRGSDTLKVLSEWHEPQVSRWVPLSFARGSILGLRRGPSGTIALGLAHLGKQWQEIAPVFGKAVLLNSDNILLLHRHTLHADLLDASGKVLQRYDVPFAGRHMALSPAGVSPDGKIFASYFLGQSNIFVSGSWFVFIWDAVEAEPIALIQFKWAPIYPPKIAFCPGDSQIVAVDGGRLQSFNLPSFGSLPIAERVHK